MGAGSYNSAASAYRSANRVATGAKLFDFSSRATQIHPSLDVKNKPFRECRDNADNPVSIPIAVFIDVTGSNTSAAEPMMQDFHKCMSVILDAGVEYPTVLIGATGDSRSDQAPFQVGEFEASDELLEECTGKIWLEGNGGGQQKESYAIPLAYAYHNIKTDHWDKRGKKGHLFIVADEGSHDLLESDLSRFAINGTPMTTKEAFELAATRWNIYILRPKESMYKNDKKIIAFWEDIAGADRVIPLESYAQLNGTIASLTALNEGIDPATLKAVVDKHGVQVSSSVSIVPKDDSSNLASIEDEEATLTRI